MFVILNPHVSDFYFEPISYRIIKRRALKKYNYIFSALPSGEKITILIDGSGTGMIPMSIYLLLPLFLRRLVSRFELQWWLRINKLNGLVNVCYRKEKLDPSLKVFAFAYKIFQAKKNLLKTCNYFSGSVFHLSHYHGFTREISETLSQINNCTLAADADNSEAPFFREFFNWYKKPVTIIPFEVAERFKVRTNLRDRKPKAIALGTFHRFNEGATAREQRILKEYMEFTGANELHPVRRQIFDNPARVAPYMDSMISPYIEKKGNFLSKIFKTFFTQQKKYFSFDIVDKYNEYQFTIVGEELHNGLPGIGSFEGMACGCVLIGNELCYRGLGMQDGVHYLSYTGSLDELLKRVDEGMNMQLDQLESISKNAVEYVQQHFSRTVLCARFAETMNQQA